MLSVIQMCDQGHNVLFHSKGCKVMDANTGKIVVKAVITSGNVYVLEEGKEKCCIDKNDESWIWKKRLGHISFNQLVKLGRKYVVRDIPKISKPKNIVYKSCQFGKQSRVQFKARENSTKQPLEMIDIYLCGPTSTKSPLGERYFILLIDDYTKMT
jgi:hypothetical protein